MSTFPGPPSHSEFLAAEARREREESRSEAQYQAPERSAEEHGLDEALQLRITLLKCTKADMMTTRELDKTIRALEAALDAIRRMADEIVQLRQQARKAGDSEGK